MILMEDINQQKLLKMVNHLITPHMKKYQVYLAKIMLSVKISGGKSFTRHTFMQIGNWPVFNILGSFSKAI